MFFGKRTQPSNPSFFPWDDRAYSVGVRAFDQDHRQLVQLVNELHTAMIVQRERVASLQLVDRLILETRHHFHREEQALRAAGYPDCEAHFQEHGQLLKEAEDLRRSYTTGSVSALVLPTFFKNWLTTHILGSDRNYASCLRRAERL